MVEPRREGKIESQQHTSLLLMRSVADLLHQSLLHQNTHKVVFPEKLVQCELRRREDIIEFVLDSPLKNCIYASQITRFTPAVN